MKSSAYDLKIHGQFLLLPTITKTRWKQKNLFSPFSLPVSCQISILFSTLSTNWVFYILGAGIYRHKTHFSSKHWHVPVFHFKRVTSTVRGSNYSKLASGYYSLYGIISLVGVSPLSVIEPKTRKVQPIRASLSSPFGSLTAVTGEHYYPFPLYGVFIPNVLSVVYLGSKLKYFSYF